MLHLCNSDFFRVVECAKSKFKLFQLVVCLLNGNTILKDSWNICFPHYDRWYSKFKHCVVWSSMFCFPLTGGWAVVTCPCGVVYGIKFNIRAESPRDFTDLLLSMKHFPNVSLYDFARGLATHANIRTPETFNPHGGRLLEPSAENIQLANSGEIKVNLPWLLTKKSVPDENGHPITGSSDHYALYDRFHEANSKDSRDVLRKVELVPELCGWLNSQCAEQLFSAMRRNSLPLLTSFWCETSCIIITTTGTLKL